MKMPPLVLYACIALPIIIVLVYVLNPLEARTMDPRGRLLGVIPSYNPSISMEPTIKKGSTILACTASHVRSELNVGDIVIFHSPGDQSPWFKRIAALGGDSVEFKEGILYRNSKKQIENYISGPGEPADIEAYEIPAGSVYVLGDNRTNSDDSRFFGPINTDSIIAKVCLY